MEKEEVVLGSSSIWRKEILQHMGYAFTTLHADIDERAFGDRRNGDAQELTRIVARAKQEALLPKIKRPSILITSDQVVVCQGIIREKPSHKRQMRAWLQSYRDFPADCVTTVCAFNTLTQRGASVIDQARIWMHKLTDSVIEQLVGETTLFSCAGAIAVGYPMFDKYVKDIEGAEDSVKGLPANLTEVLIESLRKKRS